MRSKIMYGLLALLLLAACSSASGAAPEINSKDDVPRITPKEVVAQQEAGKQVILVDARSVESFQERHIAGAISVPMVEVEDHLLTEEAGWNVMATRFGVPEDSIREMSEIMGISGVCNVLASIKTARFYGMRERDTIFTVATDTMDRYHSVMKALSETYGPMDEVEAVARMSSIFHGAGLDWIREGTHHARQCWFNLKYYTWVEQQGKTVEELDAQRDPEFWLAEQAKVQETDRRLRELRGR